MSIEDVLLKWSRSEKGRKKLNAKAEEKTGIKGTTGGISFGDDDGEYGENLLQKIIDDAHEIIANGIPLDETYGDPLIGPDDIVTSTPEKVSGNKYIVNFTFDKSAIHRDSLKPNNDGVWNIVSLFTNGYSIPEERGDFFGDWQDHRGNVHPDTFPLLKREPDDSLIRAVDEFNRKYKGVCEMTLSPIYTSGD